MFRKLTVVFIALLFISLLWPTEVTYQGKLTDSLGVAVNGDVDVILEVFDSSLAGSLITSDTVTVTCTNGLFSGVFDLFTAITTSPDFPFSLYYEISVNMGDGYKSLTPRKSITSEIRTIWANFALYSQTSDTAHWIDSVFAENTKYDDSETSLGTDNVQDAIGILASTMVAGDTIWAGELANLNDTICALDYLYVERELITDSIQPPLDMDTVYLDGNFRIYDDLIVDGNITGNFDITTKYDTIYAGYLDDLNDTIYALDYLYVEREIITDSIQPPFEMDTVYLDGNFRIYDNLVVDGNIIGEVTVKFDSIYAGYIDDWNDTIYALDYLYVERELITDSIQPPLDMDTVYLDGNFRIYDDLIVDGNITGNFDITTKYDTIYAGYLDNLNDTIYALDYLYVERELITDSIQAPLDMDTVYLDGNFRIYDDLIVDGKIIGEVTVKYDTIYAGYLDDLNDTIRALDYLYIERELITDSIQPPLDMDTVYLDGNFRIYDDLIVDGKIIGEVTAKYDTIYAGYLDDLNDTIYALDYLYVERELITDSIQPPIDMDTVYLDGNFRIYDNLVVDGKIIGEVTVKFDSIYAGYLEDLNDTIYALDYLYVERELITDSIQPPLDMDTVYLDGNFRIYDNLIVDGNIIGEVTTKYDTLYAGYLDDWNDTIYALDYLYVERELITDSIQPPLDMDTVYLDGNFRIYDDLVVDGKITGNFDITTKYDTIYAGYLNDWDDTIRALDFLNVKREVITDSIQAEGNYVFINDTTVFYHAAAVRTNNAIAPLTVSADDENAGIFAGDPSKASFSNAVVEVAYEFKDVSFGSYVGIGSDIKATPNDTLPFVSSMVGLTEIDGDLLTLWGIGGFFQVTNLESHSENTGILAGIICVANNKGDISGKEIAGEFRANNEGYTPISVGLASYIANEGTVDEAYGLYIESENSTGATIGANYGLYICDIIDVGDENFAIFVEDGYSYFHADYREPATIYSEYDLMGNMSSSSGNAAIFGELSRGRCFEDDEINNFLGGLGVGTFVYDTLEMYAGVYGELFSEYESIPVFGGLAVTTNDTSDDCIHILNAGVYGFGETDYEFKNWAGYFDGDVNITNDLNIEGDLYLSGDIFASFDTIYAGCLEDWNDTIYAPDFLKVERELITDSIQAPFGKDTVYIDGDLRIYGSLTVDEEIIHPADKNIVFVSKGGTSTGPVVFDNLGNATSYVNARSPSAYNRWLIIIRPGIFTETDTVSINGFTTITGAGKNSSLIDLNGNPMRIGMSTSTALYVKFEDMQFVNGSISSGGSFIDATYSDATEFIGVYFADGIYVDMNPSSSRYISFTQCIFEVPSWEIGTDTQAAVNLGLGDSSVVADIRECLFISATDASEPVAILVDRAEVNIHDCKFNELFGGIKALSDNEARLQISDCRFTGVESYCINLDSDYANIHNCIFTGSSSIKDDEAIQIFEDVVVEIIGCSFTKFITGVKIIDENDIVKVEACDFHDFNDIASGTYSPRGIWVQDIADSTSTTLELYIIGNLFTNIKTSGTASSDSVCAVCISYPPDKFLFNNNDVNGIGSGIGSSYGILIDYSETSFSSDAFQINNNKFLNIENDCIHQEAGQWPSSSVISGNSFQCEENPIDIKVTGTSLRLAIFGNTFDWDASTYYAIKKTSSSANDNVTVANNLFLKKDKMYEVTSPQKCDDNFDGKFNQDYTGDDTAGNTGSTGDNPNCN